MLHAEAGYDTGMVGKMHLAADPSEQTNLWDDPAHRGLRGHLQEFLLDVLVATEDRSQPREAFW